MCLEEEKFEKEERTRKLCLKKGHVAVMPLKLSYENAEIGE